MYELGEPGFIQSLIGKIKGLIDIKADKSYVDNKLEVISDVKSGNYTGNGYPSNTITLGAKPKAVLVVSHEYIGTSTANGPMHPYTALIVDGVTNNNPMITILSDGFRVYYNSNDRVYTNFDNYVFNYIAIM